MNVKMQNGQFSLVEKMQSDSMDEAIFQKFTSCVVQTPPCAAHAPQSIPQGPYVPATNFDPVKLQQFSLSCNRFMPRMANMRNTQRTIMSKLNIPMIDCMREVTMTFISQFLVMILRGRRVRSNFMMLRFIPESSMSTTDMQTMKKSSLFHVVLRYASSPEMNPFEIILSMH